ncbi:MAG: hypothetical protein J6M35_00915, partial [Clostridia bacterium]|nr:hypothetical protein [Clostridia bacterium]
KKVLGSPKTLLKRKNNFIFSVLAQHKISPIKLTILPAAFRRGASKTDLPLGRFCGKRVGCS